MKTFDAQTLYELLPLTVRMRDAANGYQLQALMGVIAAQATIVDDNLYQLYDDSFIETCSPWAIPYIGDLIGYRPLRPIPPSDGPERSDVADTIGLRRRKGTLVMLDQLARDVTGWPAVAVEYFARLATSQYVRNHLRPQNACVDVHGYETALRIGGAFDLAPRSADVRRIASGRGHYNIPNVGLFVWRLGAFGGAQPSTARAVGPNMYAFDPFGDDVALVNPPRPLPEFAVPGETNVPFRLRRFPLYGELEALRAGTLAPDAATFFGATPVLAVYDAGGVPIPPAQLAVCDLSRWQAPTDPAIAAAVDPELGRLTFNPARGGAPPTVRVAYDYAFGGPYGAGNYPHPADQSEGAVTLEVADLAAATPDDWRAAVVEIADNGIFLGNVRWQPDASGLVVRAEDEVRPTIAGDVVVVATPGASLTLRGIGIGGRLFVVAAGPALGENPAFSLTLEQCTVRGALNWTYAGGGTLRIDHSLCAQLFVDPTVEIGVADSVVDAGRPRPATAGSSAAASGASLHAVDAFAAIAGPDGWGDCGLLTLTACTVFGDVLTREIALIENSIVTGTVISERTQAGCVRYSYLRPAPYSRVPPRYRCQPDLAIDATIAAARKANPALGAIAAQAIADGIAAWLVPVFTSREKSAAGYAQLADACPAEIRTGAESADEMGVFHGLYAPRREGNLRLRLDEYLRVGLEAGIIHAS